MSQAQERRLLVVYPRTGVARHGPVPTHVTQMAAAVLECHRLEMGVCSCYWNSHHIDDTHAKHAAREIRALLVYEFPEQLATLIEGEVIRDRQGLVLIRCRDGWRPLGAGVRLRRPRLHVPALPATHLADWG